MCNKWASYISSSHYLPQDPVLRLSSLMLSTAGPNWKVRCGKRSSEICLEKYAPIPKAPSGFNGMHNSFGCTVTNYNLNSRRLDKESSCDESATGHPWSLLSTESDNRCPQMSIYSYSVTRCASLPSLTLSNLLRPVPLRCRMTQPFAKSLSALS